MAFLQVVGNGVDALVGDLADVKQTVLAREQLNDGTEIEQARHRAFIDLALFNFSSDFLDALLRGQAGFRIHRGDRHAAVVFDVDRSTGFFGDAANHSTALTDHVTDLFRIDLHRDHARSKAGQFLSTACGLRAHFIQNVLTAFVGLSQGNLHDFLVDAFDLDIHLQGGDTVFGTGHLEVHIAQVVFVTQNVGENSKLVAFLDKTHGNASHVVLHRDAGVHQGQAPAADARHRRRAVRFADFRDHADRVLEIFFRRQHSGQSALSQTAMADFAALGAAHAARFTGGKRGHVVVQHKAFMRFTQQTVNDLFVLLRTQRRNDQSLGFTTGKQCGTVGARKHALADFDRAHGLRVAAVDTRFAIQNLGADKLGFHFEKDAGHFVGINSVVAREAFVLGQFFIDHGIDFTQLVIAGLLATDGISFLQTGIGQFGDTGDQFFVLRSRLPIPSGLAGFFNQFVDGVDGHLLLFMTEHHSVEHHVFGQAIGFGFNHEHGAFGAAHHQIQTAVLHLRQFRVANEFAVDVAHAAGADRAVKRNAGNRQRGRSAQH